MSTSSERAPFVEARFLEDLEACSREMDAPCDTELIKSIIHAYGDIFYEGAIQVRGSDGPGVPLMIRVLLPATCDTVDISLKHGWLQPDNPLIPIVRGVRERFPNAHEQPEFTVDQGLDGVFIELGAFRPLEQVMAIPAIPDCIRTHKQTFIDLDLTVLQTVAVNYKTQHVHFVFLAQGPTTKERVTQLVALCGAPTPSDEVYADISGVLLDSPFYVAVVMEFATGKIVKTEFYLFFPIKLPNEMRLPELGDRLAAFWDMPSYETEDMDILSYGFGDTSIGDVYALRSHCGGMRNLLQSWGTVGS